MIALPDLLGGELPLLDEEVRGLDVAMHDVGVVRGAQALERVLDDGRDLGEREVLLAAEALVEPFADEPLEGDPQAAVLLFSGAQDGRHEGRLDLLGDVRFAIEARDQVRVLGGTFVEDFEGDLFASATLRSVHLTHPTLADQPADLVDPADYRSWRQARLGSHIPVERSTASPARDKHWLLGPPSKTRWAAREFPESTARSAVEQRGQPLYARLPGPRRHKPWPARPRG